MSLIAANAPAHAVRAYVEDAGAIDEYIGGDKVEVSIMSTSVDLTADVILKNTDAEANRAEDEEVQEQEHPETQPHSFTSLFTTIIELVSTSATSSAFPEPLGLSVSSSGKWIMAYSSSAMFILSTLHLPYHRERYRAFRLRRKPIAVAMTDAGRLAVLTTPHKIDVYQCGTGDEAPLSGTNQKIETVFLDNEAKTLALAENGEVMAAGSDGCIEIRNLGAGTLATDKRQIQCGPLDSIEFSRDGRSILMTAAARRARNTTVISVNGAFEAAMFQDDDEEEQPLGKMWISQLLFPERVQCRQAIFMPEGGAGHVNELIGFDANNDQFGIFDVAAKQFIGRTLGIPEDFRFSRAERFDDCLPAVTADVSHAATVVRLKDKHEIWMYRLPESWSEDDDGQSREYDSDASRKLRPSLQSALPRRGESSPAETFSCLRWVNPKASGSRSYRLVGLISTAALSVPEDVVHSGAPAASGKIAILDFGEEDLQTQSPPQQVTIDLDDFPVHENLADEELELEQEVELVRRRTRIQRRHTPISPRNSRVRRSLSSSSASGATFRDAAESAAILPRRRRSFSSISSAGEDNELPIVAVDEPYSHSQPRTQFQLQRAASVSAQSAAARLHLRALPNQPLEYRRADGLRQMPHESDADNWVPPPPPYSERPDNTVSHPVAAFPNAVVSLLPRSSSRAPAPVQAPISATSQLRAVPEARRSISSNLTQRTIANAITGMPAIQGLIRTTQAASPRPPQTHGQTLPMQSPPPMTPISPIAPPRQPVDTQQSATQPDMTLSPAVSSQPPEPGVLNSPMTFPPTPHPHGSAPPHFK